MAANIQKNNNKKSIVELVRSIRNNVEVEILKIDGISCGIMGYTNEKDRESGIATIQNIVDNSNNTGFALVNEVIKAMTIAAEQKENGISPDDILEEVKVNNKSFWISYSKKEAYSDYGANKIASCAEIKGITKNVIKAILIDRITLSLTK